MEKKYICPVCGFSGLEEKPFNEYGYGSNDICPSCGTEFGFELIDQYKLSKILQLRKEWLNTGPIMWRTHEVISLEQLVEQVGSQIDSDIIILTKLLN